MSTYKPVIDALKKPARVADWHKADIICGLWKIGTSLQKLSREHGYGRTALGMVIYRPWPKGERIIADALGVQPHAIWPSRYHVDGTPKGGRGERGRQKTKDSTSSAAVNVHARRAA